MDWRAAAKMTDAAPSADTILRAAVDSMAEAVIICDADFRLLFANAQAERSLGRFLAKLRDGATFAQAAAAATRRLRPALTEAEADRIARQMEAAFQAGARARVRGDDGAPLDARLSRLPNGEFVAIMVDMSAQIARQTDLMRALDRAERGAEARAAQMAELSHELRTPLTGLLGMAQVLSHQNLTPEQHEMVLTLRRSGAALIELLSATIVQSQDALTQDALSPAEHDPRAVLADAAALWRPLAKAKNIEIEVFVAPDVPRALSLDALRVGQCLSNLISNAVRYTSGSLIEVRGAMGADGRSLLVHVTDDGAGVDPALAGTLFDPFVRGPVHADLPGSGLGLALTRRLARLHGGDVIAVTPPEGGARFTLHVEVAVGAAPDRGVGGRVLIVDDDASNRAVVRHMLDSLELDLSEAATAAEAQAAIAAEPPDLVLLDLNLPDLSGTDLVSAIAERMLTPRIVVLTGDQSVLRTPMPDAVRSTLLKPVDMEALREAVISVLAQRGDTRTSDGT
jgi:signal transduction histidine kinase/CheY-like chemotaxis protein